MLTKTMQAAAMSIDYLGDECVSVCDVRLLVLLLSVPEVQLDTAAAGEQDLPVHLQAGPPWIVD
jgi:hypothetical protein